MGQANNTQAAMAQANASYPASSTPRRQEPEEEIIDTSSKKKGTS